jgi:hypothetical protein
MYIPAVPLTPMNQAYIEKQKERFLTADRPPDFPQGMSEAKFAGIATVKDMISAEGRRAMGFDAEEAAPERRRFSLPILSQIFNR